MPISGYFDIPFASSGTVTPVPDATQPDGTVSYTQGFPIAYSTPVSSGGYNVPRAGFNQIFNDITSALQYFQQGKPAAFITAAMHSGLPFSYNKYSRVLSGGVAYTSLVDSNTDTPPTSKWGVDRIVLSAATTYYVATTGSDSNAGTISSPWLTIQHALDYIRQYVDTGGFAVTISVADGTYTGNAIANGSFTGGGVITLQGNTTTPANCNLTPASSDAIALTNGAQLAIAGFKITAAGGNSINCGPGSIATINGNMEFGACASTASHLYANFGGQIVANSNYKVSGGGQYHVNSFINSTAQLQGRSLNITGTPGFVGGFANASQCGTIQIYAATFSGTATGPRYNVTLNGVINTAGGGSTYLPGNSGGTSATGGQYA